jgi:signal transduction histidine kinase
MWKVKRFWQKISQTGIHPDLSLADRKRIRLLNQTVVFLGITQLIIMMLDFLAQDGPGGAISFMAAVLCFAPLYFHRSGWYRFSRWFFLSFILALISLVSMLYGKELRIEIAFVGITVLGFVLLARQRSQWILLFISLFIYVIVQVFWRNFESPYAEQFNPMSNHLGFGAILAGLLLIIRIFTWESQAAEKELQVMNRDLSRANQDLERFASMASHDLKTPLRNINSFLGLISRRLGQEDNPELLEYLNFASSNAKQMYYLVNEILDYSRLGQNVAPPQKIDLNDCLQVALGHLQTYIRSRSVELTADPLPSIMGQKNQWSLLFQNLIENGIKYNGHLRPKIHIASTFRPQEQAVLISIEDNGIGIKEEYREQIFEMFKRLHPEGTYSGTGIGLAICQKIVLQHGGQILATDREDGRRGARFEIHLAESTVVEMSEKEKEAPRINLSSVPQ